MEFLSEIYPDSPRTRLKKLLQGGTLRVNDRPVSYFAYPLKPGDTVEINKQAGRAARAGLPFPVLYEDNEIIVIDKPPGRPTSSIDGSLSMQEIVSDYLVRQTKGKYQAHIVHRLDKEVSGVLLMAKSAEAMAVLKNSWKMTEKHYYALVEGVPEKKEDTIRSWLEETAKQKVQSAGNRENAKLAVTHYKVIKAFGDHSLLDIRTDTGRKNQIRVHLSEMGHPIIGDRKYGASAEFVRRVRLHAYSIAFPHPSTGRLLTIKSPMPAGYLSLKPKDEKYKP
jgi:23S rRNA pseudouridine1911/1915/1917 synthase